MGDPRLVARPSLAAALHPHRKEPDAAARMNVASANTITSALQAGVRSAEDKWFGQGDFAAESERGLWKSRLRPAPAPIAAGTELPPASAASRFAPLRCAATCLLTGIAVGKQCTASAQPPARRPTGHSFYGSFCKTTVCMRFSPARPPCCRAAAGSVGLGGSRVPPAPSRLLGGGRSPRPSPCCSPWAASKLPASARTHRGTALRRSSRCSRNQRLLLRWEKLPREVSEKV